MKDNLVLGIRTTAGHAAPTIASLIDDVFAPEPPRRVRPTQTLEPVALETAKVLIPATDTQPAFDIDEWLDRSVLEPFTIDWDAMVTEAPVAEPQAPVIAAAPRRVSRDQRRREELGDRLQAMRAQMAEVKLRVAMLTPTISAN
jgi:hypothetical protein